MKAAALDLVQVAKELDFLGTALGYKRLEAVEQSSIGERGEGRRREHEGAPL